MLAESFAITCVYITLTLARGIIRKNFTYCVLVLNLLYSILLIMFVMYSLPIFPVLGLYTASEMFAVKRYLCSTTWSHAMCDNLHISCLKCVPPYSNIAVLAN